MNLEMSLRRQFILAVAVFLLTLCLALSAGWAIRQPRGERYILPTRQPTLAPGLEIGYANMAESL
jgi:hypothetical protein